MKVNPKILIGNGDLVKLNKAGLDVFSENYMHRDEIFKVDNIFHDYDDFKSCIEDNGIDLAMNCTCHLRYRLVNTFNIINDVIFDEMDIVDLKENLL